MAKHNPTDDVMSREAAETLVNDILDRELDTESDHRNVARAVVAAFPFVHTDRARSNVPGGSKVNLRRLVLTGEWEVDPTPPSAPADRP